MEDCIHHVLGLGAVKLSYRTKAENLFIKLKRSSFIHNHNISSAYHPPTNGLTEASLIKVVNSSQDDWDEHLSAVLFACFQTKGHKFYSF